MVSLRGRRGRKSPIKMLSLVLVLGNDVAKVVADGGDDGRELWVGAC